MSPEERDRVLDRLLRVEIASASQGQSLFSIEKKLDDIIATANMGRGAWFLLLKIGFFCGGIIAAGAWVYDRLPFHK